MARLSSELVLSLNDRVSGPARGVGRSLDQLEKRQRGIGRSSRLAAQEAVEMGRAQSMMLAGASRVLAPVAGALSAGQVISSAADFETALTNIQKKSGASAEETARLGEEIKALATSGELAVPLEEIAAAYERGAAAGIPLEDLRQFASLSAKAADAFEMSATDVGNASAGFNKVLGVPLSGMERYFDLINGLADAGIADESGIVDYIDQAGAMAKTFGFSAQETAALGAALANLKVSAAKGATATNSILTRLMAPDALSSDGRTAYYKLIKDDKKFKKQLASGKASEAFVEVVDALRAMDKETRTGVIVELFGQDHLDVMTQLVEGSEELKRNLAYAAGDSWFGSLDNSYKLKLDDFWSQWQLVKNALEKLTIDAGTIGMPALKSGLDGIVSLIGQIGEGMKTLEAKVDWQSVDAARAAVGTLGADLAALLNIDTSGSTLGTFFEELAKVINEISGVVTSVTTEFSRLAQFAKDPKGYMDWATSDEGMRAHGLTPMNSESRAEAQRDAEAADGIANAKADSDRERSMGDFLNGDGVQRNPSTPAERGGRLPRPVPAFAPPMPAPLPQPSFGQITPKVSTSRPEMPVPIPTPRPDIVGPVTVEGEAAAQKATELGQRITDAFSVTATPQVNTASLDAFIAKVRQARSELDGLGAAARNTASRSASDYSGIHADIED